MVNHSLLTKVVMLDTRFGRADHAVPSPGGWSRVPKAGTTRPPHVTPATRPRHARDTSATRPRKAGYLAGVTRSACALLGVGIRSRPAPVLGEFVRGFPRDDPRLAEI